METFEGFFGSLDKSLVNLGIMGTAQIPEIPEEEEHIATDLNKPNKFKAAAADGIHTVIVQLPVKLLALSVKRIYNASFSERSFFEEWRTAAVLGIYKGEPRHKLKNCRFVSIACDLCQCLGRVFRRQIEQRLANHSNISATRTGFSAS